jgi:hypothetical protein
MVENDEAPKKKTPKAKRGAVAAAFPSTDTVDDTEKAEAQPQKATKAKANGGKAKPKKAQDEKTPAAIATDEVEPAAEPKPKPAAKKKTGGRKKKVTDSED